MIFIGCGDGRYNENEYLVLEACEYKNHYYSYLPEILLILNMDLDHPDFFKNKKDVIKSYQGMCDRSKVVVVNGDDKLSKCLEHQNILNLMKTNEVHFDDLIMDSGLSVPQLSTLLTNMEMIGLIEKLPGNYFVAK